MTRIDKAKGHVVFICKRFYALALFRELGMTKLQSTNYMNIPRILMMTLEKYILMTFWVNLGFLLQKINIYHRDYALQRRDNKVIIILYDRFIIHRTVKSFQEN